jgi:hypothetical protein
VTDHAIAYPDHRMSVVQAVLSLSSASWQRDVWLNDGEFENLDGIVHVLFDDSCDANDPLPWLGASLRTPQEADLMRELGAPGTPWWKRCRPTPTTTPISTPPPGTTS